MKRLPKGLSDGSPVVRCVDRPCIVTLSGDIDFMEVQAIQTALAPLATAEQAIIDLSTVTYFDSTALSALVRVERARGRAGLPRTTIVAGPRIRRLVETSGLHEVFRVCHTLDEARC